MCKCNHLVCCFPKAEQRKHCQEGMRGSRESYYVPSPKMEVAEVQRNGHRLGNYSYGNRQVCLLHRLPYHQPYTDDNLAITT